jgi:hypothetical protein
MRRFIVGVSAAKPNAQHDPNATAIKYRMQQHILCLTIEAVVRPALVGLPCPIMLAMPSKDRGYKNQVDRGGGL